MLQKIVYRFVYEEEHKKGNFGNHRAYSTSTHYNTKNTSFTVTERNSRRDLKRDGCYRSPYNSL